MKSKQGLMAKLAWFSRRFTQSRRAEPPRQIISHREAATSHLAPVDRLECSLARGVAMAPDLCPWECALSPDEVAPGLYNAFRAGEIVEIAGESLGEVFEAIAGVHATAYRHGSEELYAILSLLGPHGILMTPEGVAVSHPRAAVLFPVAEPSVTVCLAREPVRIGDQNSTSIRIFLAVVAPTLSGYYSVLSRLSRFLADEPWFREIREGDSLEEIMDRVFLYDCGMTDEVFHSPVNLKD